MYKKHMFFILVILASLINSFSLQALSDASVGCGDVIEAEITGGQHAHQWILQASPGTIISGKVEPIGNFLNPFVVIADPEGNWLARFNEYTQGEVETFEGVVVSATNSQLKIYGVGSNSTNTNSFGAGGDTFGAYILSLGCTLRDGTVINAGDTLEPIDNNSSQPQSTAPTFSGVGFPGLASMDFTNGVTIPFTQGVPNTGSIAQGFDGVFGFTLDVNAGETYTFDFNRVTGNLNLAIAILSPDNQIVFYGSMITSNRLSTDVLFPAAGQYTIGVYRVDFMPPGTPENTAFQVTATLQ